LYRLLPRLLRPKPAAMATEWKKIDVVLIRHAESNNNVIYETVRQRFQNLPLSAEQFEQEVAKLHSPDPVLSPKGQTQAGALGKFIAAGGLSKPITSAEDWKICSSPMRRCLHTSREIGQALNIDVTVVPFLFESEGCFLSMPGGETVGQPGMKTSEIEDEFPRFSCEAGMENGWYTLPHRESRRQFLDRSESVANWLWELLVQAPEQRGFKTGIVLSIHGNLIGALIAALFKSEMLIAHDNTGITHVQLWVDATGKRKLASIHYLNKVDHLHSRPELISGSDIVKDHWLQEFTEEVEDL